MISKKTINQIKNKLVEIEKPQKIILFGSYARNEANQNSDLDLIIIKKSNKPPHKRGLDSRWYLGSFPFTTDLLIKTPKEFEKWQEISISFNAKVKKEGKILYEQKILKN